MEEDKIKQFDILNTYTNINLSVHLNGVMYLLNVDEATTDTVNSSLD